MDQDRFHDLFKGHLINRWGADSESVDRMLAGWMKAPNGQDQPGGQMYSAPTVSREPSMPVSMLGPNTGGGYGSMAGPNMSGPGPSIAPLPTIRPGAPIPQPGYTPITPQFFPSAQAPQQGPPQMSQPDYLPPDFNANAPRFQPPPSFTDAGDVHGSRAPNDPYHATQPRPASGQAQAAAPPEQNYIDEGARNASAGRGKPATRPTYTHTATNPKTGQKMGSNDGVNWEPL